MQYEYLMFFHLATVTPCFYIGAILIAGSFTFVPGRYLHGLILG